MAPRRARREKVARTQVTRTVDERNLEEKKHHTLDSEMEETPGFKIWKIDIRDEFKSKMVFMQEAAGGSN